MTLLLFLIILGALIFVHELGHFISAKKAGIRVDEFALGFPPKLWSKKVGETVYSLNLIPFGGFVKIYGEDGDEDASVSSPPFQGGDTRGGHEERRNVEGATTTPAAPLLGNGGDGDKSDSRRFTSKSKWIQALVLCSGVLGNIIFAWLLTSGSFLSGIPSSLEGRYAAQVQEPKLTITSVLPESPAARAGLKAGDIVLSLREDARQFDSVRYGISPNAGEEVRAFIAASGGKLTVEYRRVDVTQTTEVEPVRGIVEGKPAIGVTLDTVGIVRFGTVRSFYEGALVTWDLLREVTVGLFGFIKQAILGQADLAAITGPVGIAGLVGEARVLGLVYLLSFTAFISINLADINLIPNPELYGGRLLFLAIEAIIRRPIPPKFTRVVNTAGFVLLFLFMAFITYRDIVKLL